MSVPSASEHPILQARAAGTVSAEVSFEQLYSLYRRTVYAWLMFRVGRADVDDLAQDVWTIFYRRWQTWRFEAGFEPEAKPVLSFLYRTCHLTLAGFRRARARGRAEDLSAAENAAAPAQVYRDLELNECLAAARTACAPDELSVLMGKLTGMSARDIARGIGITESAVDHGYRRAIAKVRAALGQGGRRGAR
jgi:RNA polymerase sigma factor (sigma-70 family)